MPSSRVPYRQRIREDIISKIRSGELQPGVKLRTRAELAAEYGCSIEPVVRAQEDLERDGWIETHQGKGVYVADQPPVNRTGED